MDKYIHNDRLSSRTFGFSYSTQRVNRADTLSEVEEAVGSRLGFFLVHVPSHGGRKTLQRLNIESLTRKPALANS
jgi:hypothetical protein